MRHFFTILGHEIRMLLVTPSTYVAAFLFFSLMGFLFVGLLNDYTAAPLDESPTVVFFELFFIPVLFMVPLLTMKSISEERKNGTLETLLTTPVSTVQVILGKFGAAYFMYLILWGSTGSFFYILSRFTKDFDFGPLIGCYLFVAVTGLCYISVGIFASSLSRNQAVAGIICFSLLFALIIGIEQVASLENDLIRPFKSALNEARMIDHLKDFSRGIIDVRQILFYLSGTVLGLLFSILGVEAKILHS